MTRKEILWISLAVIATTAFYCATSALQYTQFSYTGLDLAIFNQVFWNTAQGNAYSFSFHGPTYLGDHFSALIPLLAPFYAILMHPLTLLFLQSLAIGLGIIPLYGISKRVHTRVRVHFTLIWTYAFSALIGSVTFAEFHMLAFFIPLALYTYYAYHLKNFRWFIILFILTLFVREDIAFVMSVFSLLALFEKRPLKWILFPGIYALLYAYLAFSVISSHAGDSYKFLIHYSHLGGSLAEIFVNLITNPQLLLNALWYPYTITFFFYLLTPFLFLPLLSKKHLIFILPPLLQFSLSKTGILSIIQAHYVALFVPFLIIGTVFGYKKLTTTLFKWKTDQNVALGAMIILSFGAFIGLSGIQDIAGLLINPKNPVKMAFNTDVVSRAKDAQHVTTNLETLPHLSSKETIFPWMYVLRGKEQYKTTPINIPRSEYLVIDAFESFLYTSFFDVATESGANIYATSTERHELIQQFFKKNSLGVEKMADSFLLFSQNAQQFPVRKVREVKKDSSIVLDKLEITEINKTPLQKTTLGNRSFDVLPLSITFKAIQKPPQYHFQFQFYSAKNEVVKDTIIPLTYGLYPSDLWEENEYVTVDYHLIIPDEVNNSHRLSLSLVEIDNVEVYNNINGIDYTLDISKNHGEIPLEIDLESKNSSTALSYR
jgi:uncharacterized membrane protein